MVDRLSLGSDTAPRPLLAYKTASCPELGALVLSKIGAGMAPLCVLVMLLPVIVVRTVAPVVVQQSLSL